MSTSTQPQTPPPRAANPIISILATHLTIGFPDMLRFAEDTPARELLDRLADEVEAQLGFRPADAQLSPLLTTLPGVTKSRTNRGYAYDGVTLDTRGERARAAILGDVFSGLVNEEVNRLHQAHADRLHDGARYNCRCDSSGLWAKAWAAAEARPDIDQLVAERYGPALSMTLADMQAEVDAMEAARAANPAFYAIVAALADAPDDDDQSEGSDQRDEDDDLW